MKKTIIVLVISSILLIIMLFFSFDLFLKTKKENVKEIVKTGTVSMTYKDVTNGLMLKNLTPLTDDVGKIQRSEGSYFDFAITSDVDYNTNIDYEIAIVKDAKSTIPDNYIKVYLEKESNGIYSKVADPKIFTTNKNKSKIGSPAQSMILNRSSVSSSSVDNYRLRIWIKEGAIITDPNASFSVRVNVYGKAR